MSAVVEKLNPGRSPEWLPTSRQGDYLETVSSKAGDARLVSTGPPFEVIELNLKKDMRLTLTPAGRTVERFVVLAGQLSCALPHGPRIVGVRDYIVTENLEEPVILSALTDACLLYITPQPQFHALSEKLNQLRQLAVEVEVRDGYTFDHCDRLQALSFATGQELGLSASHLLLLDHGAYLHDVGKIKVPLSILNKPTKLNPDEWTIIKRHPTFGRELLEGTYMKGVGAIVEQHHERLDGSGYPYGLSGDEVLVESAIVAVADTYDAMTTDRPYQRALGQEEAFAELRKYAGIYYPGDVVKAFLSAIKRLEL